LKDYTKEVILAPLFKLFEAVLELFVPLIIALMIDRGIRDLDTPFVLRMGAVMLTFSFFGFAFSITAQFFAAKAAIGFGTKLRHALFSKLLGLSYSKVDQLGSSAMITRMTSDIPQIQTGVNMVLRLFLRSPIVVVGAAVMAFTIDWQGAIIFTIVIPLLTVVIFLILWKTIPLYRKVQEALDHVLGQVRENLIGVRVLRAFTQERAQTEVFQKRNTTYQSRQLGAGRISALLNPLTFLLVNTALLVLIHFGALQVNIGNLSQGEVVALINYLSLILVELVKLANLIVTMTKALACAQRVADALEVADTPGAADAPGAVDAPKVADTAAVAGASPYIRFDHVSLTYEGAQQESLQNIHFDVKEGQVIGIIGGTGSGKTSLINLLARFYEVTQGRILLGGEDIRSMDVNSLRRRIGIVSQRATLFRGTIQSNLLMGDPNATTQEMMQALEIAQALDMVGHSPEGLQREVEAGGTNFSGGQRQRLTIARTLLKKPDILILDDSSSALDYATDAKLRSALQGVKVKALFIISQRSFTIRHADQILVLDDGELAAIGTHDELIQQSKLYHDICEVG
ncbi:MAG: ABC transporter ATP-binding protein/permease, partial [Clostridium sp.]|nr:ABC transporter ATP-binding protein/permease [Clostridium sp.]